MGSFTRAIVGLMFAGVAPREALHWKNYNVLFIDELKSRIFPI